MVERDYKQIGRGIALTGFFSEYLPQCFSLDPKVLCYPPASDCDMIPPYSFTMSRFNGNDARRTIFIPEIGSYLAAHFYMEENNIIQELIEYTDCDSHSFSPILSSDNTIMRHEQVYYDDPAEEELSSSLYILNIGEKIIRSAGAKRILKLDISNCFASFYMHMIPAIVLGADGAEEAYYKFIRNNTDPGIPPNYYKYRKLDEAIRRQNLNRTNGLLPGILSSKIIAEAILTRIDHELETLGLQFVRYVDDYEVFLYDNEENRVITNFSNILKKYGFSLNAEKTEVIEFPFYLVKNFEKIIGTKLNNELDYESLIDIFNKFFEMERDGTKGAIRYLLKRFEQTTPTISTPGLYKAYLLTVIANNERSLSKSCALLISRKDLLPLTPSEKDRIREMLKNHLSSGHDLEVLWLLYLLVEIDCIHQEDSLIEEIVTANQELAISLLLRRNLLTPNLLMQVQRQATSWLLLYELYATGHLAEEDFTKRLILEKNLPMYKRFRHKGIHFVS